MWLDTENLPLEYANLSDERSTKLRDRWVGPFEITKQAASPNAWFLNLPSTWRIHQPINASRLKEDVSDPSRPRHPPSLRRTTAGAEWAVERLVVHRTTSKVLTSIAAGGKDVPQSGTHGNPSRPLEERKRH